MNPLVEAAIDAVLRHRNWGYTPSPEHISPKEREELRRELLAALVGALEKMFEEEGR